MQCKKVCILSTPYLAPLVAPFKLHWCTKMLTHFPSVDNPRYITAERIILLTFVKVAAESVTLPHNSSYFSYLSKSPWRDESKGPDFSGHKSPSLTIDVTKWFMPSEEMAQHLQAMQKGQQWLESCDASSYSTCACALVSLSLPRTYAANTSYDEVLASCLQLSFPFIESLEWASCECLEEWKSATQLDINASLSEDFQIRFQGPVECKLFF